MPDNSVTLEFGAKIDKLVAGVDAVRGQLDSLRETASRTGEAFKTIAEIVGIAFTLEGIKAYIEHMAELGLQTERTMAMLGQSAAQVGVLSGVAKLTGTSLESLALNIERTSLNVQRSTADALNPQAQALKVLGLTAKELIGLPTDQYFLKLAEAVSKFNPSLNLTNALMAIGGRNAAQMLPFLLQGAEGFRKLEGQVRAAQGGLAAAVPGMADTHLKISLLELSVQSLGARIFSVLKPAIDWAVTGLTKFVQSIDAQTIQTAVANVITWSTNAIVVVGMIFQSLIDWIDKAIQKMSEYASKAKSVGAGAAGGAAAGALGGAVVGGPVGAVVGGIGGAVVGGAIGAMDIGKRIAGAFEAVETEVKKIEAKEPAWAASIRKMSADLMSAIAHPDAHGAGGTGGLDAKAIDEGVRLKLAAAMERIQTEIDASKRALEQKKVLYDLDSALWKTTEQQKIAATAGAVREAFQLEAIKLQQMRDLWPAHSREWEALNRKMLDATQQFNTEMLKLNAQSLQDQQKKWADVFGAITSSFNSSLRGILTGTATWAQLWRNLALDMLMYFIQIVEKMALEWAAGQLAQVTATVTAEGAKTAAVAAGSAAQTAATLPSIISSIMASVGKIFAAVTAWFAPTLGPAAPAAGAVVAAGVAAGAIGMTKAAVGAWEIPGTSMWQLHPKEMVLPAGPAEVFRNMAEGGGMPGQGGGHTFNISALDARSLAGWLKRGGADMITRATSMKATMNPTLRPAF